MRLLISICLAVFAVFTLLYLAGAFIAWDMNPAEWDASSRFLMVGVGGAISVGAGLLIVDVRREAA